jgi:hypothetical protein
MKQVDKELAALNRRHAALEAELAASGTDHEVLRRVGGEMAEVSTAVAAAEERWLALAEEAESARGSR